MPKNELHIIGRLERINLPNWDLIGLEAKVDTGAYSSSIHCSHIYSFEKNNEIWVRFQLLDPEHSAYNHKTFEVPVSDVRDVKSSNGSVESRYFVSTIIELNKQLIEAELSLTDRSEMKYPVLLGRKFLLNRFLVDVSKSNVS